jgi:signal transduction histidine kinase
MTFDGFFEAAAHGCFEALCVVDAQWQIRFANRRLVEQFGVELPQSMQELFGERSPVPWWSVEDMLVRDGRTSVTLSDTEGNEQRLDVEVESVSAHAALRLVWLRKQPHSDSGARRAVNLEWQALHAKDATDRTRLHAGIAHDFNNLMATVLGHAAILRLKTTDLEFIQSIAEIELATQQASALIHKLKPSVAHEEGDQQEDVNLSVLLSRAIRLAHVSYPSVEFLPLDDLTTQPTFLRASPVDLFQIFYNLLSNAGDAVESNGGQVLVRLRAVDEHPPLTFGAIPKADAIRVDVVDTGAGISPHALPSIFDPYFSTKAVTRALGSGLGLSTVRDLVLKLGGALAVLPAEAQGTCFSLFFAAKGISASRTS